MKPTPSSRTCAKCHYDLLGLPDIGKCPECGNPYSTAEGFGLVRPSDGLSTHRKHKRIRTLAIVAGAALVFVAGGLLSLIAPHPERAWGMGGFLALVILFGALVSWMDEKE